MALVKKSKTFVAGDVSGKVALVTGGNSGVGFATCMALAKAGATVILACERDAEKSVYAIKSEVPGANVEAGPLLDLKYLDSVHKFAEYVLEKYTKIDILVNCAGVAHMPDLYFDGVHVYSQINCLGPYTLTRLLEKTLITSRARIVTIASIMHRSVRIKDVETFYHDKNIVYEHTKLANVLFAFELQRRLGPLGVTSCVADPGGVYTPLFDRAPVILSPFGGLLRVLFKFCYTPPSEGAASVIHAATVPWEKEHKDVNGVPVAVTQDLRYYTRGLFASNAICNSGPIYDKITAIIWLLTTRLYTLVDWPLRRFSGGFLCSWVGPVNASKVAYDEELALKMWNKSADLAKLPREVVL